MLQHLECPRKGLVGSWAHVYRTFATPVSQIGFLGESRRRWHKWHKGKETGIMDEPMPRCYLQGTVPSRTHYVFRSGRWVAKSSWPAPGIKPRTLKFSAGRISEEPASTSDQQLSTCSKLTVGFAEGLWCSVRRSSAAALQATSQTP
ncbi:hypothetical protein G647_07851 [Cladophialophora carrionii CBS 160.54]|uniref:Uncharacterized protein n=1 Tax=Cladophialophora carrionii CBS 160.54 TaxID=1279043 RepID=V9D3M6_9EURO|nr:uncharacterized protein G647_07851 [Cladophialophora carrionii CBS 160.54]ETI21504.1 hypothetical protein G647_07851 [Cladophialophora carrionii CBS 160.54]